MNRKNNMTSYTDKDPTFNEDGKPLSTIQWLRGHKLNGIAAFDLVATAIVAFILSGKGYMHVLVIFILLIILAIGVHYAMGIPTMMNHYLNINTLEEVIEGRKTRGEHI